MPIRTAKQAAALGAAISFFWGIQRYLSAGWNEKFNFHQWLMSCEPATSGPFNASERQFLKQWMRWESSSPAGEQKPIADF
jgi:hypothetical protein